MRDSPESSGDLLDRLRAGDQHALGELFSQHRERLWRTVHFRLDRRLGGRVDADDILQEAFLDAAQRIDHYLQDPQMSLFVWLRLIVNQTLIDVHRRHLGTQRRDPRRERSIHGRSYSQETSISIAVHLLGNLTSPSAAAARAELSDQLERAIAEMEPIDQEVLALRHFEELTNGEIAEVLGIQAKAASIRYVRALKRLKGILEQLPGFVGEV